MISSFGPLTVLSRMRGARMTEITNVALYLAEKYGLISKKRS